MLAAVSCRCYLVTRLHSLGRTYDRSPRKLVTIRSKGANQYLKNTGTYTP